jgi:hypothetical protein
VFAPLKESRAEQMKYKPRIFLIKPSFICVDFLLFHTRERERDPLKEKKLVKCEKKCDKKSKTSEGERGKSFFSHIQALRLYKCVYFIRFFIMRQVEIYGKHLRLHQ